MLSKNTILVLWVMSVCVCSAAPLEEIFPVTRVADCPAGYYCVSNGLTRSITPQPCPAGTYSGIGASICIACAEGYYTVKPASAFCDVCPIGHSCANPTLSPTPCALGTYNPSLGQTGCWPCDAGDYTPTLHSSSCTACPNGHFCETPAEQPKFCPPGKEMIEKC